MKKVINYLGLRKVAINLQLDKLPPNVDQYVAEVGAELEEELRQIDQALLVLSNVVGQREQLHKYWQIKKEFITPDLKKRFPSIIDWAFEKEWWINNKIAKEEELEPLSI